MSDPKILNLDGLVVEDKLVQFNGKEFKVLPMMVGEYIDTSAEVERLSEQTGSEAVISLIDQLLKSLEGATMKDMRKMTTDQLMALLNFVRGEKEADEGNE